MKMIITIISNNDMSNVENELTVKGFYATKISSYGMFLKDGNTTLCIATDDDKTDKVIELIKTSTTKRTVRQYGVESTLQGSLLKQPIDIEENGAVIFIIPIDCCIKF